MRRRGVLISILSWLAVIPAHAAEPFAGAPASGIKVHFNQEVIDGLNVDLDLNDTLSVFDLVFSQLADTVRVYPSENYYYFQFAAHGQIVWGNLRLDAHDRDQGILHLGYFRYDENGRTEDREGHFKELSAADGVVVTKRGPFEYEVSAKGRTVRFLLNDMGMTPPRGARLAAEESFVGPVFDESGLPFHLLFDRTGKHFFYVLNEDGRVPETFDPLGEDLLIGRRTGFAFYDDRAQGRKILVAVMRRNSARNNYYDGPFDQLPDNYVDQTRIVSFMEEAYPESKGTLDRFGTYLHQAGGRLVVMPYTQWENEKDLEYVAACKKKGGSKSSFLRCITPDLQQTGGCREGSPCTGAAVIGTTNLKFTVPPAAPPKKVRRPPGR